LNEQARYYYLILLVCGIGYAIPLALMFFHVDKTEKPRWESLKQNQLIKNNQRKQQIKSRFRQLDLDNYK
jgi:hypothetical protein